MALNFIPKLTTLSIMLLVFVSMTTFLTQASHDHHHGFKETHLSMYFHDIFGGPNATDTEIAGVPGKLWTFTQFGTLFAFDDPITEGPHPNSALVGRAQGLDMTAGLDGLTAGVYFSVVFTNKKYNGSTLEIQGNYKQFEAVGEVSVVSGTGKFRFARGYATIETYAVLQTTPFIRSVLRVNVTVQHQKYPKI